MNGSEYMMSTKESHHQRDAGTVERPHEHVAPVAIGAEPVRVGEIRRRLDTVPIDLIERVRRQIRRQDRQRPDNAKHDHRDDRGTVAQQPRQGVLPQAAPFYLGDAGQFVARAWNADHHSSLTLGSSQA
jgi:hypothetical protein